MMIYTVGHTVSYEQGLAELGPLFMKLGKRADHHGKPYGGGSVWRHETEAQAYLAANADSLSTYSVYGVIAEWEADTEQLSDEPFRRLVRDAQLVRTERSSEPTKG